MQMNSTVKCTLCPRRCNVDRTKGNTGFCQMTDEIMIARAALHMWEEPCISGEAGSGAVFFSGCTLGCVFCQNRDISRGRAGKVISIERLVEIFFELKSQGANNINLVTPDHYIPQIVTAIKIARSRGFDLPFVYNSSGYETAENIRMLDGYIDIYLPDFKYMTSDLAAKYSLAADYPERAKETIAEMVRQVGEAKFYDKKAQVHSDSLGIMKKGVIVRHLILPGHIEESKLIIKYLYETYGDTIYLSIMNQYTPMEGIGEKYPELDRKVTEEEYDEVVDYAIELGVENGFIQEGETADDSFIPAFDGEGV